MSLPSPTLLHKGGRSSRRVAVLNKLFMRHITDLMATGEVAGELIGRGIEISRVKVASDFTRVNVYWLAKGSRHDDQTEMILSRNAHSLRHELSQLRIIGSVPRIEFVKGKKDIGLRSLGLDTSILFLCIFVDTTFVPRVGHLRTYSS